MIGIYKITNKVNNKSYIGQSISIQHRWYQHIHDSRPHKNSLIHKAIKKYGIDNFSFEVLEECPTELLNEREKYWINYYNTTDKNIGYNIRIGGENGGEVFDSELIRQLWREGKSIGQIKTLLNIKRDVTISKRLIDEENYSISEAHRRGIIQSEKTIEGKPVYQYDLQGNFIKAYSNSVEAAKAFTISENGDTNIRHVCCGRRNTAYGYQWSEIKQERIPAFQPQNSLRVCCQNTGEIFDSIAEACKWAKIVSHSNISECCKGKRKSAGKHPITKEKLYWEFC